MTTDAVCDPPILASQGPFGAADIERWLPHRYPFLLIDRVLEHVPRSHITAVKNVSVNEGFFQGHFPGQPVMPGVLMLEALAQTAGVMVVRESGLRYQDGTLLYFAGIDAVRFKRPVIPGDVLTLEARVLKWRSALFKFAAQALVDGEPACEAELTAVARTTPPAGS